jgi:hypothetical protein
MPYGIMPDSARQEESATTYGLINRMFRARRGLPKWQLHAWPH